MQAKHHLRRIAAAFVLTATTVAGVTGTSPVTAADGDLVITGVIDGPLTGGLPKAIEVYAQTDIADLSAFGLGSANNGGGSDGEEFTFPAVAVSAGTFLYVASEAPQFTAFFGFAPDYTTGAANINGDDAIELFEDDSAVDVFGDINTDGTGQPWEHLDGWAKRNNINAAASTTFVVADWTYSGPNALDGETSNATATTPFPLGTSVAPAPLVKIHEVQGNGAASPLVGQVVMIEGIVVGDFQDGTSGTTGDLDGFVVQEQDADTDADALTSEGIFVFDGSSPAVDVKIGDAVTVEGVVSEFFGLTEITSFTGVTVDSSGNALPPATSISLPVASVDDFEAFEGMRVTFPQTLYATGNYTQARYGEVDLSVGGPLDNPTNVVAPGVPAAALQDLNNRSRIQLEDGSTAQNPLPLPPYLGEGNTLRTGDTVDGLTAVMHYGFGLYELQPIEPINFTRVNERLAPPDVGGSITVAAYNVLNYFTTLDDSGPICGPVGGQGCRGADTQTEFDQQRAKLVAAISELDADIVGLMEIENSAGDGPTADLVAGLNDATYAGKYDYIATGPVGNDAIKVAIIFQPESVSPLGPYAVLDSTIDPTFNDEKNRAVLAQTFSENGTDDVVTVAVNHLKSKGSDCDDIGDPDVGDGQGNCNVTRTTAAQALVEWLDDDPTGVSEGQSLIIGDLNSYAQEDPIVAIEDGGYTDLIESFVGTGFADGAYSYNFFSQSGYLDHGLASPAVLPRVTGASFWHVNADEPSGLDYNNFNQPDLFTADAFRSSDHDPVVIGVCETTAPVVDVSVSPETMSPPNHKMFSVEATVSIVDADPNTTVQVSVTSNEPDNGLGDGDHPNDIVIVDDDSFELRAERSGLGDGRVYTITYEVTDACGNTTTESATVTIPHHRGPKGNWK